MFIVTGGAGFIGSNLIKALNSKGIVDILVVDNLKNGNKISNLIDLKITDYINKKEFLIQVKERKKNGNIKAVFHCGACSSTIEKNGNYVMYNNYQYSKELLNYCIEWKIPFLYASSSAIYGANSTDCVESRKNEKPLNVYGYSKFLFDEYVRQVLPVVNSQITGFRYFNVYGPRENHKGKMASILFHFFSQLKNGENLELFEGSENFKRDFVYVEDVSSVNLWFLESGISGIFNFGTGHAKSYQEAAHIVISLYKKGSVKYIPFPEELKGRYQTFTQANLIKLRTAGYNKPLISLTEGAKKYKNWLSNNM